MQNAKNLATVENARELFFTEHENSTAQNSNWLKSKKCIKKDNNYKPIIKIGL